MSSFRVRYFSDVNTPSAPIWNAGFIKGYEVTPVGPYPDNSVISFNSALNLWTVGTGGSGTDATSLRGVDIATTAVPPTLTDGQVLVYNSTSGEWEAQDPAGGLAFDTNGNLIGTNQIITATGSDNLILGDLAGPTTVSDNNNVILGAEAGQQNGTVCSVAVGYRAMSQSSGDGAIAIGCQAGENGQSDNTVALGYHAGQTGQGIGATAIGLQAGQTNQGSSSIAIGVNAGQSDQDLFSVAIGNSAGASNQGDNAVAIGNITGNRDQGNNAVAVGSNAGETDQGDSAVAIGISAGQNTQGSQSVAIGLEAAQNTQGAQSIAIGFRAGEDSLGVNTIAIGGLSGQTVSAANSIGLNASGTVLDMPSSGLYIDPVRDLTISSTVTSVAQYDPTSKEVVYRTGIQEDDDSVNINKKLDLSGVQSGVINDVGNGVLGWYEFINGNLLGDSSGNSNTLTSVDFFTNTQYLDEYRGRQNVVRTQFGVNGSHFLQSNIAAGVNSSDMTLSTWFLLEPSTQTGNLYMLFYVDNDSPIVGVGGEIDSIQIYISNATEMGRVAVRYRTPSPFIDYTVESTTTYDDGIWHHFVTVITTSSVTVYVDNEVVTLIPTGTPPSNFDPQNTVNRFSIGAYYFGASPLSPAYSVNDYDVPYLSNYIVFQTALSASDVQTLYTGAPVCGPLSLDGLLLTTGVQANAIATDTLTVTEIEYTSPFVHLVVTRGVQQVAGVGGTRIIDFTTNSTITSLSSASHFTIAPTGITINVAGAYHYGYTMRWQQDDTGRRLTAISGGLSTLVNDGVINNQAVSSNDFGLAVTGSFFTGVVVPAGTSFYLDAFTSGETNPNLGIQFGTVWIYRVY
jgi:hypothetical protein